MEGKKAGRNKTIDTPLSEGKAYLDRCISVSDPQETIAAVLDKTILGDSFAVCLCCRQKASI